MPALFLALKKTNFQNRSTLRTRRNLASKELAAFNTILVTKDGNKLIMTDHDEQRKYRERHPAKLKLK